MAFMLCYVNGDVAPRRVSKVQTQVTSCLLIEQYSLLKTFLPYFLMSYACHHSYFYLIYENLPLVTCCNLYLQRLFVPSLFIFLSIDSHSIGYNLLLFSLPPCTFCIYTNLLTLVIVNYSRSIQNFHISSKKSRNFQHGENLWLMQTK